MLVRAPEQAMKMPCHEFLENRKSFVTVSLVEVL